MDDHDTRVCRELEQLSLACVDSLNARDFKFSSPAGQELTSRISSDYTAILGNMSPSPMTWNEMIAVLQVFLTDNPKLKYEVRSIESNIDPKTKNAMIFIEMNMSGVETIVTMHNMSTWLWKQDVGGRWVWYRLWNMRNIPGICDGFV